MEDTSPSDSIIKVSAAEIVDMADDWYEFALPSHFWIQWRFNSITKIKNLKINSHERSLEIGCGHGVVMKQFEDHYKTTVDGCDLNLFALQQIKGVSGKIYLLNIFDKPEFLISKYHAVLLLDVIEHIDNDLEFLSTSCEYLKDDGIVIINVPALNWLFSKYDKAAGHKRRYSKKMIHQLFKSNEIEEISIEYWGFFLVPIAFLRKIILMFTPKERVIKTGFSTPNKMINSLFKGLMRLEKLMIKRPWIGTSIVAVGQIRPRQK